jgi:hypothetical protein
MAEIKVDTAQGPETNRPDSDAPLNDSEREELARLRKEKTAPKDLTDAETDHLDLTGKDADSAKPLSDADRKDLAAFRAEKANRDNAGNEDEKPLPDTHWLHLGDGTVVKAKGTATHVGDLPVLHAVEIPGALIEGGDPNAEPAHRF